MRISSSNRRKRRRPRPRWTSPASPRSPPRAPRTGPGRAPRGRPRHPVRAPRAVVVRWLAQALPEVYAANATSSASACSGRNGSVPARPASPYAVRVTAVWIAASGSGRRDRPVAARDQPRAGAVQVAERVLPARPAPPPGTGSSGRPSASSWQAHSVCRLAATPSSREPRHVVRVDELEVRDVVPERPVGAGHRVQRLADAAVADRVHVHLEAGRVERADGVPSASASTNECPRLSVAWPHRSR